MSSVTADSPILTDMGGSWHSDRPILTAVVVSVLLHAVAIYFLPGWRTPVLKNKVITVELQKPVIQEPPKPIEQPAKALDKAKRRKQPRPPKSTSASRNRFSGKSCNRHRHRRLSLNSRDPSRNPQCGPKRAKNRLRNHVRSLRRSPMFWRAPSRARSHAMSRCRTSGLNRDRISSLRRAPSRMWPHAKCGRNHARSHAISRVRSSLLNRGRCKTPSLEWHRLRSRAVSHRHN